MSNAAKYFTGVACGNGHLAERYIAGGRCVECERLGRIRWKERVSGHRERGVPGRRKGYKVGISSRDLAIAEGKSLYFTGAPCIRGHVCERFVTNRHCVECSRERQSKKRPRTIFGRVRANASTEERKKQIAKSSNARWRKMNIEKARAMARESQRKFNLKARIAIKVLEELGIKI